VLSRERLEDPTAKGGWYSPILRPRSGVTAAQAQAGLDAAIAFLESEGRADARYGLRLETLRDRRKGYVQLVNSLVP
jgi:hypothetical protein